MGTPRHVVLNSNGYPRPQLLHWTVSNCSFTMPLRVICVGSRRHLTKSLKNDRLQRWIGKCRKIEKALAIDKSQKNLPIDKPSGYKKTKWYWGVQGIQRVTGSPSGVGLELWVETIREQFSWPPPHWTFHACLQWDAQIPELSPASSLKNGRWQWWVGKDMEMEKAPPLEILSTDWEYRSTEAEGKRNQGIRRHTDSPSGSSAGTLGRTFWGAV